MLHEVERDERPSTAEARLTVHGKAAFLRLGNLHEALDDGVGRVATVREIEVIVVEASFEELLAIVDLVIEAHDARHVHPAEIVKVGLRRIGRNPVHVCNRGLRWSAEGEKLSGHNPVEVAIFDALIVVVLFRVKRLWVIPAKLLAPREALEAVKHREIEAGRAERGIAVRAEHRLKAHKRRKSLLWRFVVVEEAPAADEHDRVGARIMLWSAAVHNALAFEAFVRELRVQQPAILRDA
mmetsp:Transcript_19423/g.58648  ORF Transcript_19423/g.58648 Transcript_19423/m.58648 type:complete len:239 (+) Transcript_19423:944-1660(+)